MKKRKEKWIKEETIKIKKLMEITENPKGCFTNKEKLINVKIEKGNYSVSTSFSISKKGTKDLLKFIKEELYLK